MEIGSRIREERIKKKITQSALVGDKITRNMLSAIETGKATPSLETLIYISNRLELPVTYFLTEQETAFSLKKSQSIEKIKKQKEIIMNSIIVAIIIMITAIFMTKKIQKVEF